MTRLCEISNAALCAAKTVVVDYLLWIMTRVRNIVAVPLMRKVTGQKAFSYRGTNVWNKFNNNINEAPAAYSFKSRLRQLGYENL